MKPKRFFFHQTQIFGRQLRCGVPLAAGFMFLISGLTADAGDILRGGTPSSNKPGRPGASTRTPAATDAARANARDTLARTSRTLDSIRAMQDAARKAAANNNGNGLARPAKAGVKVTLPPVPNGLGTGGLQVAPTVATDSSKWTGAKLPVQQVKKNGKVTVTIEQTEQQALLNWETFNVGKKTTVTFDQSKGGADSGKWIAFNKITDPSGNPTQILGNIKADGQIYLINTNGIIFGAGSQVNARGLTASSLPINTNLITRGILNNPDAQFLFSGLDIPAGINGTPAFTADKPLTADGKYGDVVVEKGAILKSPTNSAKVGGRVTLVGPNVTNNGTIETPDGQTILAAGLQVGFDGHSSSDASLRGLDVFVGAVEDPVAGLYAGTVTQNGIIESERGSITVAGKTIHQLGALISTTSVSLNGRIDIQANYNAISNRTTANSKGDLFLFQNTGAVDLGDDSLIRILPEYDSKETTIGTELALRSQINVTGKTIRIGEDATILAPNALVNLTAGTWLYVPGSPPLSTFAQAGGQVYISKDAVIDVSGSKDVEAPVSQNIITVDLRGAELADSPLQRDDKKIRGLSVNVDIRDEGIYKGNPWLGTPLANIAGFANLIQRSVGQLTVAGGTVNISAGKSVVMQNGSKIDVSGGSTVFKAGMVKTTQLITSDGRLVDISQASPDVKYQGVYDGTFTESNEKFGVFNVFHGALAPSGYRFDPGSTQGAAGGKIAISAPSMALDGKFEGKTITGERQRLTPPAMSSLSLSFQAQDTNYQSLPIHAPSPPTVTFDSSIKQTAAGAFAVDAAGDPLDLSAERKELVVLSSDLFAKNGFGSLTVDNHDGKIIVPEGINLDAPTGGSITFKASNITVDGSITAAAGSISLSTYGLTYDQTNQLLTTPIFSPLVVQQGRGIFTLGATGSISTAGLVVDDRLKEGVDLVAPVALKGGSIKIEGYSVKLAKGGLVDVSGGASLGSTGSVSYGNGGSLSIAAGREVGVGSTLGGTLALGSELRGLSGAKAGSISVTAPAIQIGGETTNPNVTLIRPGFFSTGGFGTISLTGIGLATSESGVFTPGVLIDKGVEIRPVVDGWLGDVGANDHFRLTQITRDEGERQAASLSFGAVGATFSGAILSRGDVVMDKGSLIRTDGLGTVSFSGQTITLLGSVITPGGAISVTGPVSYPVNSSEFPTHALPTIHLGNQALLSAAGKVILTDNAFGLRQGQVLAGGSIKITGNIVAEAGALLDVSGTKGTLDLPASSKALEPSDVGGFGGRQYVPVTIESNAGTITLAGSEMIFSDATFAGHAGGDSAMGGTLVVSSNSFTPIGVPYTTADANLVVTQHGIALPDTNNKIGVGIEVLDNDGDIAPQLGHLAVDSFEDGGFDSLTLGGNVRFDGNVSISLPGKLRVADGGVIYADGKVRLTAGYVALGQAFRPPSIQQGALFSQGIAGALTPYFLTPSYGTGEFTVRADLIDIGNLSLQGIGKATLLAPDGDVRGNGTFQMSGDLVIKAGQIYPPTQSEFDIFAYDHASFAGSVTILKGKPRPLPFSAGGTLSIYASEITQNGSLSAPIGTINLGWDGTGKAPVNAIAGSSISSPVTANLTLGSGSVTSVSAIDPITKQPGIIPYGISFDGDSWIDPMGNNITVDGSPEKRVNLAAGNLVTEADSTVDIRGGGDLYAYRWVAGNGGTKDVLASTTSFAVIPGYGFDYAPYAPFNTDSSATNLAGQPGYTNPSLNVGDQITLAGIKGLAAGTYTLLPARYALLPGAFLITPQTGGTVNTSRLPDGSSIISGYRFNSLSDARTGVTTISRFEIASAEVVRERSEYQDFFANTFLRQAALDNDVAIPRLAIDSGYLSFSSTDDMSLKGGVDSLAPEKGRGGLIDINSSSDILINETGNGGSSGQLVLKASQLNNFGAESLLIGGLRESGPDGMQVSVNTDSLKLDNEGTPLEGSDIILVSNGKLTLARKSEITATSNGDAAFDVLLFGDEKIAGSGNGSLVRVSSNNSGGVSRFGVSTPNAAALKVGSLAVLTGGSIAPSEEAAGDGSLTALTGGNIVLDSTAATQLSASARLSAEDISLSSGQISILLNNPGSLNPTAGLVLAGEALTSLQSSAKRLSLLSYSTLDVYGKGTVGTRDFESLSLQAAAIRGFNSGANAVKFTAANLILGNSSNASPMTPVAGGQGSLIFEADNITLGANAMLLEGFSESTLSASGKILFSGKGSLAASGTLALTAGLITGDSASEYKISSSGLLRVNRSEGADADLTGSGIGANLSLEGDRVNINGDISLLSGKLTLRALSGDLNVGNNAHASLDLGGSRSVLVDTVRYTSGGTLNLFADNGSVDVGKNSSISVAAQSAAGNAGVINVRTPNGSFKLKGSISGTAGDDGLKGSFTLDTGSIDGSSTSGIDAILNAGDFTLLRDYRIRTGDVSIDGAVFSNTYRVSADSGDIVVSETIDASGQTGGTIDLKANGSLILKDGAFLNASGEEFNAAGKGGAVFLEAGNQRNGEVDDSATLDLRTGSRINLSVAAKTADSESRGMFSGTLHLRAPRTDDNKDLRIEAIGSTISGASSIVAEGVKLYGITGAGTITSTIQTSIRNDATAFLGAAGATTAGYTAMHDRLTSLQPSLDVTIAPGVEIFNLTGDLVLGTTTSTGTSDWNLQTFRFGPKSAAGVLTLRAAGDLVFYNALSDGFAAVTPSAANGNSALWLAPLMARNNLLSANNQSWSYRFTSGADLASADFRAVLSESQLAAGKGSFLLGKNAANAATTGSGANHTTARAISGRYQVIRTGSGDITINSARNTYLLNQFATIYTAGTLIDNPTTVLTSGDFVVPMLLSSTGRHPAQGPALGANQQQYFVQYSMAGGDVSISAGGDIAHMTRNVTSATGGDLIDDSSRQLPTNWLYRRGYIDPITGESGIAGVDDGTATLTDPNASTTWWVDFSNFFEGVGTLGGGNIKLTAGNDVKNVDALAPTNARMAGGKPSRDAMVELGGGNITISAGRNIDGGVYYVERGKGTLTAGAEITTNATRSPSRGIIESLTNPQVFGDETWLPTTFFVGKGGFDIQSSGDLLLGPSANPFLLPQGINNKFWYKTYFNTFGTDSYINATSLGGSVNLRTAATLPSAANEVNMLTAWATSQYYLTLSNSPASFQPWLRLAETEVSPFQTTSSLMAPTLTTYALGGDINIAGNLTLFPSRKGQLELVAKGSINGLQPTGFNENDGVERWVSSTINLSDVDPQSVPGITSPFTYLQVVGRNVSDQRVTDSGLGAGFLDSINAKFVETGSTSGALQDEQQLHTPGGLHRDDDQPVRLYAEDGNIEGLTLFSPKSSRIIAGFDIGDVSLYIQNLSSSDFSVVSAGRDLTPYNANTGSRIEANLATASNPALGSSPLAGDIQIAGPGNLQVLTGRNLDLGFGSGNADGTGVGITSIGNGRNPFLGFGGADLIIGAGIGPSSSLNASQLDFGAFIKQFATSPQGNRYLAEANGVLGVTTVSIGKGTKTQAKVVSVTPGGAADNAGVKPGDILLGISDRKITGGYDDSFLLSGVKVGEETKLQVRRGSKNLKLDVTPGSNMLDLADPDLDPDKQRQLALSLFYLALRDTGRDFNDPDSDTYREYKDGLKAIKALFPKSINWDGEILTQSRDIRTRSGGDISIFAPGGGLTMANTTIGNPLTPPGIVTESGGDISIFTHQSVDIGIGRIFTLKGGNAVIWSSKGDIAAGSSSRTVSAAPPTRVVIDPQSASVETDLAGLATGGGIGVLATVKGVEAGDVDLIAPSGIIDAGDAGIRVSGNINLAAVTIVNAGNISAGGSSTGTPTTTVSGPSISAVTSASNSTAATTSTAVSPAEQKPPETAVTEDTPDSLISVDIIGYGEPGSTDGDEDEEKEKESDGQKSESE